MAAYLPERVARDLPAITAAVLVVLCAIVVGSISLDRQYFNVDTETDFLGTFMPDAERLARGVPLVMAYHPPGYPAVLALVQGGLGDWLASGLLVSWLATICVLLATYDLFRRVGGGWAAVGALVGLATSDLFLAYGGQATSDVPFLALWMTSLALTAAALKAEARWWWVVVGVVVGFCLLTRTNGIVLALLVGAPLLTQRQFGARVGNSAAAAAGIAVSIGAWLWLASVTESPIAPTDNHANLALRYFAEGHRQGDGLEFVKGRFTSVWQVIAHDPLRLIEIYVKDLVWLPKRILTQTMWPPVAMIGALLFPLWLVRLKDPGVSIVLITTLASALLMNLHAFEPRFYLLVVPLLGASAALPFSRWRHERSRSWFVPIAAAAGIVLVTVAGLLVAVPRARTKAEAPVVRAQLAEAVPAVRRYTPAEAIVVSRKPNLAFHAQRRDVELPFMTTIADLCMPVQDQLRNGSVYIYIGWAEQRRHRVELSRQLMRDELPPWLDVAAQGSAGGGWRLLAVKRAACGNGNPGRS
jgi:hypothetical protein